MSPVDAPAIPKGSTVLITGANGFTSSNIIDTVLRSGFRVRGTVRDPAKDAWLLGLLKKYSENKFELAAVPDITCEGAFGDAVKDVSAAIHVASLKNLDPDPEGEDLTTTRPRDRAEGILKELGRPGWKSLEGSVKGELGKNSTRGHPIQCSLQIVPLDAFHLGEKIGFAAMDFVDFRYWGIRLPADEAHYRKLRLVTLAPDDPFWDTLTTPDDSSLLSLQQRHMRHVRRIEAMVAVF